MPKTEAEAFERVRQGQTAEALSLLNGSEYRALKQRYSDALASFTAHLKGHQTALLAQARAETQAFVALAMAAAMIVLLLFVAAGCVALGALRRA